MTPNVLKGDLNLVLSDADFEALPEEMQPTYQEYDLDMLEVSTIETRVLVDMIWVCFQIPRLPLYLKQRFTNNPHNRVVKLTI